MKVVLAADHIGAVVKNEIKKYLTNKDYEVLDLTPSNPPIDDYPDYAFELCEVIVKKKADSGILVNTTGIGMSIAANKVKGIRCALVSNVNEATLAREHNNANVLALGTSINLNEILKIVDIFLKTDFGKEERHARRVEKIIKYENEN